ncbi:MAG: SAM-dependent methyltransferase [Nocardioidaceae bacterium]
MVAARNERLQQLMHTGDRMAWSTAAVVLALGDDGTDDQRQAAGDVADALGLTLGDLAEPERRGAAAQAAAPLLQAAALLHGDGMLWSGQSDEALLAQGRTSAQGVAMFARLGLPLLPGLAEALARQGARMLDVGTGVAALAVAYAEHFPALTVVGIDVLPRVLALAAQTASASSVADRVVLREQDVGTLDEEAAYDLVWLPAPFVPGAALRAGLPRVASALLPGGWVLLGHGKFTGEHLDDTLTRFKTLAFGGTALDDHQAQQVLKDSAFEAVSTMPTPPGTPGITVGRKPAGHLPSDR